MERPMARSERVEFSGTDGQMLAARLDHAIGRPRAIALFAHCFSCSKDVFAARRIASQLARKGVTVLRFDFTGLGNSEGDFANTNFSSNVQDLVAAARWLEGQDMAPGVLIGHSLGGAAVVVAAQHLPSVKAVATIGAPSDASHVLHQFSASLDRIEQEGEAEVLLAGRPFKIKKAFLDDVRDHSVTDAARDLKRALLVLHSPVDAVVGIDNAAGLFIAARHPKSFVSLDQADHLLSRADDAYRVADVIAAWAEPYAKTHLPPFPKPDDGPRAARVWETRMSPYEGAMVIGDHSLLVDEPDDLGGMDAGPDPFELVNAGLAACTMMTLRMYADRKAIPLVRADVTVTHHSEKAAPETGLTGNVFERRIRLEGDLTHEQRTRLIEIAERCPVHRALASSNTIRTEAVDG